MAGVRGLGCGDSERFAMGALQEPQIYPITSSAHVEMELLEV